VTQIEIDPVARTARVGAGVTWAELDEATQEHGLAVTGARVSRRAVAVEDGSGWLERSLGLTGDSLIGADGTTLLLRLHAVGPTLLCGFLGFPRDRAREVARAYRDFMRTAPGELGGGLLLGAGLGGVCNVVVCHLGTVEEGEQVIAPLRALGPSLDAVAPNEYRAFQRMWDDSHPEGTRSHDREVRVRDLPDDCLDAAIARADLPAASLSYLFLRPLGGVLPEGWACHCVGLWPPVPALDAGQIAWVDGLAEALTSARPAPAPRARGRGARGRPAGAG
jgi:FAD/FMN-containing dehydrogenase